MRIDLDGLLASFLLFIAMVSASPPTIAAENLKLHQIRQDVLPKGNSDLKFAFGPQNFYLATAKGLYQGPADPASPAALKLCAFEDQRVDDIHFLQDWLYVLKASKEVKNEEPTEHSFLRTKDAFKTMQTLDEGLKSKTGDYVQFLPPFQMVTKSDTTFVNAGGGQNILATQDGGKSYKVLYGQFGMQACYSQSLLLDGKNLYSGGECPLDMAYLKKGTLAVDLVSWTAKPVPVSSSPLSNRRIQFIERLNKDFLFAGTEGGLMRSTDNGINWDFVMVYGEEMNSTKYPYVQSIGLSTDGKLMLAGGFDKVANKKFLALSTDNGHTWSDTSDVLPKDSQCAYVINNHGQLLVGAWTDNTKLLQIFEIESLSHTSAKVK